MRETYVKYALLTALVALVTHVRTTVRADSFARFYEKGVEAYLEERYAQCVEYLENAVEAFRIQKKRIQNCRLNCKHESDESIPLFPIDIEDLRFFEKTVRNTLCILRCQKRNMGGIVYHVDSEIGNIFDKRKPYEYLHLCYYKINDKQKAAGSAFTFLVANPEHSLMKRNFQHYSEMPEVDPSEIINYEAEAEDECRAQCEGPFDPGWYPDFVMSISNHFTFVLKCKRNCSKILGNVNGQVYDDLFASHYNYLQYAYFKKGNLMAACHAVASFLLLFPADESMLSNMKYYRSLPKTQDNYFTPREEVIRYADRDKYERQIIEFVQAEFVSIAAVVANSDQARDRKSHELTNNGYLRASWDDVASSKECQLLINIADTFASVNEGYTGINTTFLSPHTEHEKFAGVSLARIQFLVYIGILKAEYLNSLLDLTDRIREIVALQFNIAKTLYFSYTHLVCRSALPASPVNRDDWSHQIHADNCNLIRDGKCEKKEPAFYWRDYSAILYLNDDFQGGEFVFAEDANGINVQATINPKCGRMVAFSSGIENLHGVRPVSKGKRCALAIWFTFDPRQRESDRDIASYIINNHIRLDDFIEKNLNN
ncbi:prolyl 3-hydroxylase 1-like isoform X2 [Cylas formicarius]|uniref:prolyl 3-hydroxylase 1-like isoform X2 n=1 Tax=Cylas formicarius TaxID=197179 RepID=UPI0029583DBC|nr:prolyl 3-hydroxylase 1-like isoform X2 [Cylas formicarius]